MNELINKIHNCDNREILKQLPDKSVQVFLEDMPYNTTNCDFEYDVDLKEYWELRLLKIKDNGCFVLFGQEPFSSRLRSSNLKIYKYDLYWKKHKPTNFLQLKRRFGKTIEIISIFYKNQCIYNPKMVKYNGKPIKNKPKGKIGKIVDEKEHYVIPYSDNGYRYPCDLLIYNRDKYTNIIHPTQKPVALFEYLIKTYNNENDLIFDGFSGSGTTAISCYNTNRNFICCELEKEYYDKSIERLKVVTDQMTIF